MTVREHIEIFMKLFEPIKDKQPNYYFYRWLLEKGRLGDTRKFTKKELKFIKDKLRLSGIAPQAKECYYVSQLLVFSAIEDFKYVEGYAVSIIPTEHAWLEYNGKVLDIVWGGLDSSKSPDGFSADPKNEYFGIEVPHNLIAENVGEREIAESLLPLLFEKERSASTLN